MLNVIETHGMETEQKKNDVKERLNIFTQKGRLVQVLQVGKDHLEWIFETDENTTEKEYAINEIQRLEKQRDEQMNEIIEKDRVLKQMAEALGQFKYAFPYSPPCRDWQSKADAHNLANKALAEYAKLGGE